MMQLVCIGMAKEEYKNHLFKYQALGYSFYGNTEGIGESDNEGEDVV